MFVGVFFETIGGHVSKQPPFRGIRPGEGCRKSFGVLQDCEGRGGESCDPVDCKGRDYSSIEAVRYLASQKFVHSEEPRTQMPALAQVKAVLLQA